MSAFTIKTEEEKMDRIEIGEGLEKLADIAMGLSRTSQVLGFPRDRFARILREARIILTVPVPVDTEGGGSTWFHVCEECHGTVDVKDSYCRHCGRELDWNA